MPDSNLNFFPGLSRDRPEVSDLGRDPEHAPQRGRGLRPDAFFSPDLTFADLVEVDDFDAGAIITFMCFSFR